MPRENLPQGAWVPTPPPEGGERRKDRLRERRWRRRSSSSLPPPVRLHRPPSCPFFLLSPAAACVHRTISVTSDISPAKPVVFCGKQWVKWPRTVDWITVNGIFFGCCFLVVVVVLKFNCFEGWRMHLSKYLLLLLFFWNTVYFSGNRLEFFRLLSI